MAWIRQLLEKKLLNRLALSRRICEEFNWRKPDGGLKEMSCRVALLRMQHDGLLTLPSPTRRNGNGLASRRRTTRADPGAPLCMSVGKLRELRLDLVDTKEDSLLWNEYVDRYHYLAYQPLPGAQLRYFARAENQVIALLGFGAAAWTTAPRDRFIGWDTYQRGKRLHLIVNNARFLILPWVTSKNLASRLLSMASRIIADDWHARYAYRPVLLETFVEKDRFFGTCYRAANWTYLGETSGRGKLGGHHDKGAIKTVWVFPLKPNFRSDLLP